MTENRRKDLLDSMGLDKKKNGAVVRSGTCAAGQRSPDPKRSDASKRNTLDPDDRLADTLKAMAHPVRIRILRLLSECGGDLCVCEIEVHFELRQPTISHHLKILKDAGLIQSHQMGLRVHYRLTDNPPVDVRALMGS